MASRLGAISTAANLTASSLNAWLRLFGHEPVEPVGADPGDQAAGILGRDRVVDRRGDEDVLGLLRERLEIVERLLLHLHVDGVVGLPGRDQRDARLDLARDAAERAHDAHVPGIDLRKAEEHRGEHPDGTRNADRQQARDAVGVALDVDAVGVGIAVEDEPGADPHGNDPDDREQNPEHRDSQLMSQARTARGGIVGAGRYFRLFPAHFAVAPRRRSHRLLMIRSVQASTFRAG